MALPLVQTGDVSIERWTSKVPLEGHRILLLGATGSGKSSFIEALAGSHNLLGISGSTLASVTQDVQAFKVVNVQAKQYDNDVWPVFIIDTPGQEMLKRSEDHFGQLQNVIWKDEVKRGAVMVKFQNTQASALEILIGAQVWDSIFSSVFNPNGKTELPPLVLTELMGRIQNARHERQVILRDRFQLLTLPDPGCDLDSTLIQLLKDVDGRLTNYIHQLVVFGSPVPNVPDPESIMYQHLFSITLSWQQFIHANKFALTQSPSLSPARRAVLKKSLRASIDNFISAYVTLNTVGNPPSNVQPFAPTVKLGMLDQIKLTTLMQAKRLQLQRKAL
ncbi:hypothetical protein CVT24_003190 [Panaeolus cyanescens]|uniref:G domain-containing protein n=1 Tax=Panaeolus cyanescens TaxID=181874 RepID=A0A409W8H4_9AGAR|nr:hypothetical protein CVT24_003190 [Panaeolus cyanescens]